jgi:hypothetical protein
MPHPLSPKPLQALRPLKHIIVMGSIPQRISITDTYGKTTPSSTQEVQMMDRVAVIYRSELHWGDNYGGVRKI